MEIFKESSIILDAFTNKVALIIDKLEDGTSDMVKVRLILRNYSDGFCSFSEFAQQLEELVGV